jgi:ribonuclease P protein component
VSLPRAYRLRHRRDFQRVYQQGRRRTSTNMSVLSCLNSSKSEVTPTTRFGIVIGKKISKKAVVRNLVKRRIKAALRQLSAQISPGRMVVIGCRSGITQCEYSEILQELKKILVALEVIDGNSGRDIL